MFIHLLNNAAGRFGFIFYTGTVSDSSFSSKINNSFISEVQYCVCSSN